MEIKSSKERKSIIKHSKKRRTKIKLICLCTIMITLCVIVPVRVQETTSDEATDLAKKPRIP